MKIDSLIIKVDVETCFSCTPTLRKWRGGKVGLIQEGHLFDILAFEVGTFFWGSWGRLLVCELQ